MPYAEMAYFDGNPCAHCAAWQEWNRLRRLRCINRIPGTLSVRFGA